ncbi:hypothetical protein SLE2022_386860 [Rubroshorea leprosula]
MDESWRMRMGMPALPRRKSTESNTSMGPMKASLFFGGCAAETLGADDFSDVFGGPPRSVLSRNFSGDFTRSATFYEEVFRPPEFITPASKGGKSLPAFRIPAKNEGFYSDIFGSDDDVRRSRDRSRSNSKAKSKSNSSSVLSSEELSPLRPPVGDDAGLSSFASKLRPINVPCRWNSNEQQQRKQGTMPAFPCNQFTENEYDNNFRSSYYEFSRHACSPETVSLEPNSYGSIKLSRDDFELNSPASPVVSPASSLCEEPETRPGTMEEEEAEQEEDEVMSSYVIEINSEYREGTNEAVSIAEAIAWAKEKYQTQISPRQHEEQHSVEAEGKSSAVGDQLLDQTDGNVTGKFPLLEAEQKKWRSEEEKNRSKERIEMESMDEDIKLWSSGKENNIRLLLSTLHHILWPNSGWHAVSLTSLTDSSQVKKAYQKARLCLHPDKLQQRGATHLQKYVADKAFSILQNAWAAFVSQDVFFR